MRVKGVTETRLFGREIEKGFFTFYGRRGPKIKGFLLSMTGEAHAVRSGVCQAELKVCSLFYFLFGKKNTDRNRFKFNSSIADSSSAVSSYTFRLTEFSSRFQEQLH